MGPLLVAVRPRASAVLRQPFLGRVVGHVDARAGVGGGAAGRRQVYDDRSRISHFSQVRFALFPLIRRNDSLFRLFRGHELPQR